MNSKILGKAHILGSVRSRDGTGIIRVEDRFDTDIDDLWSALTKPDRLARWLGEVHGDLRLGGEFRARLFASEWEGTGHVEVCEPPRRFRVRTTEIAETGNVIEDVMEITLAADGHQTLLVVEQSGLPLSQLAGYGAGLQVHVEDLAAYLAGHDRCDAQVRWAEIFPAYQGLMVDIS